MPTDHRAMLARIKRFDQLIAYLRDEMGWPIARDSFDDVDDLFYDFTPTELGIDSKNAAKIQEIKRLRPLSTHQPWGIFFVKFEPKKLPVVALRRILSQVALKKRASANSAERAAWSPDDLLFVSNYGNGQSRQICFAHFKQNEAKKDLPTLKVLGWDNRDTPLHLDHVAERLADRLAWPEDEEDKDEWRTRWRSAFELGHREVITTLKLLAEELARLASAIRDRINTVLDIETEDGSVSRLMSAFKESLVHDLDEDGFADMYAQTIAYGLLSSRVTNPSGDTADDVAAAMPVTNPFLAELMETFLRVGGRRHESNGGAGIDFDELGVSEVVELLDAANMEAVVRDFGDRNPLEDPVMHFYESFLAAYDPEKRLKRGVFYTPRPIVAHMVRRVHTILREERGIEDGLADPSISILDPAAGTGTFLVEAIGFVFQLLSEKWRKAGMSPSAIQKQWNEYVPMSLLPRLYGFELMMAPYTIAHMKIGLKLKETGYRFDSSERVNVLLTDALEPAGGKGEQLALLVPTLAEEAELARSAKKGASFSVVVGNPPYKNNSDLTLAQVADRFPTLFESSRLAAQVQTRNIRDDYAWFYAAADRFADDSHGVVCLITSDSYTRIGSYEHFREQVLMHYRVVGIVRIGRSVFRDVSPRISFSVMELLRLDSPRKDAGGCSVGSVDIRSLSDGIGASELATAADPRLDLLGLVAAGASALPEAVTHKPTQERRWSFLPIGGGVVDRVLDRSLPVFTRGQDRIFGEKWPGIITAFDSLLKASDADDLCVRMRSFFEMCHSSSEISRRRLGVEEWASSNGIPEKWLDRLTYVANEVVRNDVRFSESRIKRSVSGSIPNGLRWFPPPRYRHYLYYEPRIKIPRNVNPGKFEGWGSMEQWRDDDAHQLLPKLIFTTSTNPRSGYKAFVVDDEWHVKLHGGTSQQYHFTGMQVGGRPATIDGEPNNLAGGGREILRVLRSFGLDDTSLLHLVAAVYNSSLAERFLAEESGEHLRIRIPTAASEDVCVELVELSRRMRDLHQLLYDGVVSNDAELVGTAPELAVAEGKVVYSATVDRDKVASVLEQRIAEGQEAIDELVEAYYDEG